MGNIYETDLAKVEANYVPLTPLSFIERAAKIYPDRSSIIYGTKKFTWNDTYSRCRSLAHSLKNKFDIGVGDTVSIIACNTPEIYESHFAVPMIGAVLNTINTRLEPATIQYIFEHSEAKVVLVDTEFLPNVLKATRNNKKIKVIAIEDHNSDLINKDLVSSCDGVYSKLIDDGDPNFHWLKPKDEWDAITLSYTSGTTGKPKGVVYHHRGAYLMAMGTVLAWCLPKHPVYLWIVPMFHCNGWCHPWMLAAVAGTSVCLRKIVPKAVFKEISTHKVTHFGGAPIVLKMLSEAKDDSNASFAHKVSLFTAGAPPPAQVLEVMGEMGFDVTHVYGLTETYGHVTMSAWQEKLEKATNSEMAEFKSRQGVIFPMTEDLKIISSDKKDESVPMDGQTIGEVMIKGNTVMKGYLKNKDATNEAFKDGWFHTGDLGVMYPDGYMQIKDRSKDIIISGGENISSVEVENILYKHKSVMFAAVVAMPDEKWGEIPCAFVELKDPNDKVTEEDIIAFCRQTTASFKCPKKVVFGPLPKTSTGKIQKFELRKKVKND